MFWSLCFFIVAYKEKSAVNLETATFIVEMWNESFIDAYGCGIVFSID